MKLADRLHHDNPCATCAKRCLTIPKHGCVWREPNTYVPKVDLGRAMEKMKEKET